VFAIARPQKLPRQRDESLTGIQGPLTDDGLNIVHVMAHSPAAAAGLKDGDKVCLVDGKKVRLVKSWEDGPVGKTVILGLCGGGTVSLTLRQFY
jgi:C-terminal processing protease CtpA/Prc